MDSRQLALIGWQTQQLIDGLVLSGVSQEKIDEAMNYASSKTLKDFTLKWIHSTTEEQHHD